MRIITLIISSAVLFALFALTAYSVDWVNPESESVDQMLGDTGYGVEIPPSLPYQTPQASSGPQIGKDILSMPPNAAQLNETQWFNIGLTLYHQERYNSSLQAYNKVIEINPRNAAAWNNGGIDLGMLGRYDEALSAFDRATEINSSYAEAWFNMGEVYDSLGETHSAIEAYTRATESNPNYENALINKNRDIDIVGIPHTSLYNEMTGNHYNNNLY